MSLPLWTPSAERVAAANMTAFTRRIEQKHHLALSEYGDLYRWSIAQREAFWTELWEYASIVGERGPRTLVDGAMMPGARWFPDARLNFAENLLAARTADDPGDALVFWGEDKTKRRLSHAELYRAVAGAAAGLRSAGVQTGDRVVAYMPNMPETIIAMLATAAIGAVWSSCSPDFGVRGVIDRFGQITPTVLFVADSYCQGGKTIELLDRVAAIARDLPTLRRVVVAPYFNEPSPAHALSVPAHIPHGIAWQDFARATAEPIAFERLPFDHPLCIVYSSGTTGVPRCIVHGAGGTLLQHVKEHRLHTDLNQGDRLFYFTTCGWMMWNWLVSALASGATLLLYDGSPLIRRGRILWEFAERERMTHFGTSATYLESLRKIGLAPGKDYALPALRAVLSTGSPLLPQTFDYVYDHIKSDVCLSSISGGTDIISCFALGCPTRPVWRGELQCRGLGLKVEVYDEHGAALPVDRGLRGELVCTAPFPAMPIGYWDDPGGAKYRAAYFEKYPGVWRHGDYVELTEHDGLIIHGRSDATLNPGGVRIGTAEIYRQVEQLDEVLESIVVGQAWPPGQGGDERLVLFVRLRDGIVLDADLADAIRQQVRNNATPRHVPAKILQVPDIPRTKSGKLVELAVRKVIHGEPVRNIDSLANPEALEYFRDREELKS